MDHVAIMNKKMGLIDKILDGRKTIESRWYKNRTSPWGKIKAGNRVFFKNSGELITVKAEVAKVLAFDNLTPKRVREILEKYGRDDGIAQEKMNYFYKLFSNKKYYLLIYLKKVEKIEPFEINKSGFGQMAAWMTVEDIGLRSITID